MVTPNNWNKDYAQMRRVKSIMFNVNNNVSSDVNFEEKTIWINLAHTQLNIVNCLKTYLIDEICNKHKINFFSKKIRVYMRNKKHGNSNGV